MFWAFLPHYAALNSTHHRTMSSKRYMYNVQRVKRQRLCWLGQVVCMNENTPAEKVRPAIVSDARLLIQL